VRPWMQPWTTADAGDHITRPLRHNGQPYSGINVLILWSSVETGRGWTFEKEEGFPPPIISAVDALTRRSGESDDEFVRRAASNPLPIPVKQAYFEDNLWQADQTDGDAEKYRRAGAHDLPRFDTGAEGTSSRHTLSRLARE